MIKNSIYSAPRNILGIIFPLITFSYADRILHADRMGWIEFAKYITGYFVTVAMPGAASYGLRVCTRVRGDRQKLSRLMRDILVVKGIAVALSPAYRLHESQITVSKRAEKVENNVMLKKDNLVRTGFGLNDFSIYTWYASSQECCCDKWKKVLKVG